MANAIGHRINQHDAPPAASPDVLDALKRIEDKIDDALKRIEDKTDKLTEKQQRQEKEPPAGSA